jgi:DNA-binding MurR/RpiR family transcriptional regulator
MAVTLAPTPVLVSLQMASEFCDSAEVRLFEVLSNGFPDSLQRRSAQLLADADATPEDLQRLLRAAGFTDMADLRHQVGKQLGRRLASPDLLFTSRVGYTGERASLRSVLRREQDNLAQTLGTFQVNGALEMAAAAILASRRRWVIGDMKSMGYAALFASDLSTALRDVNLISPTSAAAITALSDAHSTDSLTAFSFRNYSMFTLGVASEFHRLGGTIIAVTDDYASPICDVADHVLAVTTGSDSATHSPTAVTAVGHILASLSGAGAKGASRRSRRLHELAEAMQCYPPIESTPHAGLELES